MFQIGEFSKLVRVSPRMLRHYEKCGLLYPADIDPVTGYRRYSAEQIPLLLWIAELRDLGFGIDEIGDILPHFEDEAFLLRALAQREAAIRSLVEAEQDRLVKLARLRARLTGKESTAMQYEVILKELPKVQALTLRDTLPDYTREGELWHRLGTYMARKNIACPQVEESGYSIYWDEDFREQGVDVEIAIPVGEMGQDADGFVYRELEAVPLAATLRWQGPYEGGYTATMEKLGAWMQENGYAFAGPVRGASIRTPQDQSDPQNYLTELQIPVVKK